MASDERVVMYFFRTKCLNKILLRDYWSSYSQITFLRMVQIVLLIISQQYRFQLVLTLKLHGSQSFTTFLFLLKL